MDPILYNAAMKGNTGEGHVRLTNHHLKTAYLEDGYQVTPKGNTVLHVAALYDQWGFVGLLLKLSPALLCRQNKKNETALHIAANEGHSELVSVILGAAGEGNKEKLMRMTDDDGDTALHRAVRSQHLYVVRLLVRKDPEFEFQANKAGETPLYLAAESGLIVFWSEILESCKKPNYDVGPSNRTPLHAAVIQGSTDCAFSLWQRNKSLCEVADKWGWNSLHYAVKLGLKEIVSAMLRWKKSLAYLPAGSENDWTTAIHIAASQGDVNMIIELLTHCPDCWELLNSSGQNALHAAALNNQAKLFSSLLKFKHWGSLVDESDNDGNTPLHLFAASGNDVPEELISHPRAKKMSFRKENQAPDDIITLSWTGSIQKDKLVHDIQNTPKPKDEMEASGNIQQTEDQMSGNIQQREDQTSGSIQQREDQTSGSIQQREDQMSINIEQREDKAKRAEIDYENIMKAIQIQLVVATLIMTVTFTAGFTLPGGFDNDPNSPTKGMAILIRNTAFRAFVVTDVIAFACSAGAIFIYFFMADNNVDIDQGESLNELKGLRRLYYAAGYLQVLAMTAVVVAFITGMYATLAHLLGLAITVCCFCCISFIMYWLIIFISVSS